LVDAKRDTVKTCKARCLIRYTEGTNTYYSYFNNWTTTDDSGKFQLTFNVNPLWTACRVYPVVFPSGPEPANPVINVSDPDITIFSYWKDPDDTTLYIMREDGTGKIRPFSPDTYTVDLGWVWTDTCPPYPQPHSGCINIYETYLHARTFMYPPPTRPLRCLWEPGYLAITGMDSLILDTVWINGSDTLGGTDEWDDDILLHEFGHYVMDFYAQKPKSDTGGHAWPISYPERPGLAYGEGWAELFSCRARVGSGTDSLIINTAKGIGGDSVYLWHSIENPWKGEFDTLIFMGDPWCEGAVAGALWDIYDSKNEIPYHSYPWPGFPDTALADTLTMGFDEIWNVFDNYDPPDNPPNYPTNCWTIFHFRSGWNYYNYDHQFALNQILLHHRIRDSIPAKPTGLSATQEGNAVRLYWHKNNESDLEGYRIYRRGKKAFALPPPPWSSWAMIAEKNSPTDTTHLDETVQNKYKYQYKVTAFDSLGNESEFSDSVEILVQFGQNPDDIEPSIYLPPIVTDKLEMELFLARGSRDIILKVYDCCGRMVNEKKIKLIAGNLININLRTDSRNNRLPSGVYFLSLETDKAEKIQQKFIIIR